MLAVQGDFAEHAAMLRRAALETTDGHEVVVREVRTPLDLHDLDGLIVPGGESTTIGKLLVAYGLSRYAPRLVMACLCGARAPGMILLARDIVGSEADGRIGLMDHDRPAQRVRSPAR